jgi:hypothetical protein
VGVEGAYVIDVLGRGFYPEGRVFLTFADDPGEQAATTDADGAFAQTVVVDGQEPGEHLLRAVQRDDTRRHNEVASATGMLVVPCDLEPEIEVSPGSGPAGYAVKVLGSGFPPLSQAVMTWDHGIEAGREFIVDVSDAGDFVAWVFILPNDLTGSRTLSVVVRDQADLYPEASADYLVVPGTGAPPGGDPADIVDRR